MTSTQAEHVANCVSIIAGLILVIILLWKTRWKTLPFFTIIIAFSTLEEAVLTVASRIATQPTYNLLFWLFAVLDYSLQVALIIEIARNVIKPAQIWIAAALRQFVVLSLIGAAAALLATSAMKPTDESFNKIMYARLSLFTSLLTCLVFFALNAVANRFGLPRKDHVRAIGQGLALWNSVCVIGDVARATHVALGRVLILDYIRWSVWVSVLIYWTKVLWASEAINSEVALNKLRAAC